MLSWKKGRERFASTASIAANKGLLNEPGENNCFLNSAIQVVGYAKKIVLNSLVIYTASF